MLKYDHWINEVVSYWGASMHTTVDLERPSSEVRSVDLQACVHKAISDNLNISYDKQSLPLQ